MKLFNFLHLYFLTTLLDMYTPNTPAGVRINVKPNILTLGLTNYLPIISQYFKNIKVPDSQFSQDFAFCTLTMDIHNVKISLNDILPENVKAIPIEPNRLKLNLTMIGGTGNFTTSFACGILPSSDINTTINVNRLDAVVEVTLGHTKHSTIEGKLIPNITMSDVQIPVFEFDFDISLKFMKSVVDFAKTYLKDYILKSAITSLRTDLFPEFQALIDKEIIGLPVYLDLGYVMPELTGLAIDTSLTSGFKVSNRSGVIQSNHIGGLVNLTVPETLSSKYELSTDLPEDQNRGRDIQIFLSENFFNTALSTLYKSDRLNYLVTPEHVPEWSVIKLDSTFLNSIFKGMAKRYGKHKNVQLLFKADSDPTIHFDRKIITMRSKVHMSVAVETNSTLEECVAFSYDMVLLANIHHHHGQVNMRVDSASFSNSQIKKSLLDVNIQDIQNFFNIGSKVILPILNKGMFDKMMNFGTLVADGFDFNDLTVDVRDKYVELNVNPKLAKQIHKHLTLLEYETR
jgi:hypothetical protein